MALSSKSFFFTAAIREFHVHRDVWSPEENKELIGLHEENNAFDMFTIKTCRMGDGTTVVHLPREISRPTKYLTNRGTKVTAKLASINYRKSPLFQGGLENPCNFIGQHQGSHVQRYKEMVEELYREPKEEIVMDCFIEKNISAVDINDRVPKPKKKKIDITSLVEKLKGYQDI